MAYVKSYDGQTEWMYYLNEGDHLLEKCKAICDKTSADIKKEFVKSIIIFFWKLKISWR